MTFHISPEISVKTLFDQEPKLVKLFMELKLNCIGCPMDDFHTLADVSKENHLDLDQLLIKIHKTLFRNDGKVKNKKGDQL